MRTRLKSNASSAFIETEFYTHFCSFSNLSPFDVPLVSSLDFDDPFLVIPQISIDRLNNGKW